jgi:hypothetical protein
MTDVLAMAGQMEVPVQHILSSIRRRTFSPLYADVHFLLYADVASLRMPIPDTIRLKSLLRTARAVRKLGIQYWKLAGAPNGS